MTAAVKPIKITRTVAKNVLRIVDAGLSSGLGNQKPGEMCVEAAVCFALGLPHGDDPKCVSPALRSLKITLNDKEWSSNAARAKGLRRLSIIQLGTLGEIDDGAFAAAVAEMTIRTIVPIALRAAASMKGNAAHKTKLVAAAERCEKEGTRTAADAAAYAAYAADAAAYAADAANDANDANAYAAKRDGILSQFAEAVVQILVKMGVKAAAFLDLAPLDPTA